MYRVLYRKWRPQTFEEVYGQPHITATLKNELVSGRVAHAYLFTGSRGTGKTTCAKILSKAVNCLSPHDGDPCNECEICRGIDNGSVLDVIEIDAASNNGVDNIRDLRDEANFTPVKAKYRVYIIGEVHMLSTGAFNALLKILEEPPEHVIFILATTEVHKLPATILSRCQRFDFKRITPEDICARLQYVAEHENITLDEDAAALIAKVADGALRDALSLLDRCCAVDEHITSEVVTKSAGLAGRDYLMRLSECIIKKDCASALGIINEFMFHLRDLMIVKTVKNADSILIATDDELKSLKALAEKLPLEELLYDLNIIEDTFSQIKRSSNKRIPLEMAFVKLCSESLDSENDYTLVENLVPGTAYHVALLKSDDAVLWKDDVKTKSVTGKFPLLKYQQVDEYMLVQLLNLPADVSSYKVKLDGQEINIVNKNLNGQILTAEVTYKDGSVEILSTTIRK